MRRGTCLVCGTSGILCSSAMRGARFFWPRMNGWNGCSKFVTWLHRSTTYALHRSTTCCNVAQYTASCCDVCEAASSPARESSITTQYNVLQRSVRCRNIVHHVATSYSPLQHRKACCNINPPALDQDTASCVSLRWTLPFGVYSMLSNPAWIQCWKFRKPTSV
jgi:hypothetical protein